MRTTSATGTRRFRSSTATAIATAPLPVPTSTTRTGSASSGAARRGEAAHRLGDDGLDEPLRLGPRDQRPSVDREGDPVELLDPADVGDRLAGQPPRQRVLEPCRRLRPDRRVGMGEDRRPVDADRERRAAARRRAGPSRSRSAAAARRRSRAAPRTWPRGRSDRRAAGRRSEPDRDGDVADLAQDLRGRRPAPAVEQQVDRRVADPEVRERAPCRASRAGSGGAAPARRRSACARRPSIVSRNRNDAPAAHACGEQATGYGTGIGGRSRSKPQNSSGRRNAGEVLGRLEHVADEPVRLVVEAVALQAGRDRATCRAARPSRCGSRSGCSRAGRRRTSGSPSPRTSPGPSSRSATSRARAGDTIPVQRHWPAFDPIASAWRFSPSRAIA